MYYSLPYYELNLVKEQLPALLKVKATFSLVAFTSFFIRALLLWEQHNTRYGNHITDNE